MTTILFALIGAAIWATIWMIYDSESWIKNFIIFFFIFLGIALLSEIFPSIGSDSDVEVYYDRR